MRAAATVAALVAAGLTVSAPNARAATTCDNPPERMDHLMSIANDLCVSIEFGWEGARHGRLRARATTPSSWENIYLRNLGSWNSSCLLEVPAGWKCAGHVAIEFVGEPAEPRYGRLVEVQWSSDRSLNGILRLNEAPQRIVDVTNYAAIFDRLVMDGVPNTFALRSWINGKFVSAELGWGGDDNGTLRARATDIGFWEVFLDRS